MVDPIILSALIAFVLKNAPAWSASLGSVLLEKSRDAAFDKGKDLVLAGGERLRRRLFHLDEKEQLRHLEQALKNATERGLADYHTPQECALYGEIMQTLSQPGSSGEALRREVMQIFTLAEEPDLAALTEIYNRHQRSSDATWQDIDASPYLSSFLSALIGELYADPYFRPQLSDILRLRAAKSMQRSLFEVVSALQKIGETLEGNYSADDFARDIQVYTEHIERTLHQLKIVGVVPKDQSVDPALSGIFVPLRIALREPDPETPYNQFTDLTHRAIRRVSEEDTNADASRNALVAALEQADFLVLLGGPGSGKSTATKHLAWSHAAASQDSLASADERQIPLLAGSPIPLRIELRVLSEERKRANYDFLSFATDVLLKRDGVEVNTQMFKELLARRAMLLIFDGLDEVGTLDERLRLVNEIEHFALHYPGNRLLVTSRPVGYELARFSHPLCSHAEVQAFNDAQIQQFLANWYTSVLRLSPIPHREQEEMNSLLGALKENTRLHKLAENPLLLTVITALHRYERLPDRRVLVYDRCADLLLETWAKLKGTDKRWQDMRMIKEEQYACVAYLGFILHEQSQEKAEETEDQTVDVTARFMRKKVEDFLKQRKLITGLAERQAEAKRFIELVQQEAGLIVERGADESGEALYSFVHRTFQEYFAAADVYERYQQEEKPQIISKFLREHLHDPHWREVIMLLLGKLKSTPVTNQLRQILQGKIKSQRSCYTQIVQQDLFFVCDCLVEEIKVESVLVDMVISNLKKVVQSSWSLEQRSEALTFLGKFMQTRQYGEQGKAALLYFVKEGGELADEERLEVLQVLYLYSSTNSEERHLASQQLADLVKRQELNAELVGQTAEFLYLSSLKDSEEWQLGRMLLMGLAKRFDVSAEQMWQIHWTLYRRSLKGSEEWQLGRTLLMELVKRPELSVEQVWQTAVIFYHTNLGDSEKQKLATTLLVELVKRPELSVEQKGQTTEFLYRSSREDSKEQKLATTLLMELVKRSDLSVEQKGQTAEFLYRSSREDSKEQKLATTLLVELVKRLDLSVEQMWQTAKFLYRSSPKDSEEQKLARTLLMELVKRLELSVERMWQIAESLYFSRLEDLEAQQLAMSLLMELVKRPELSVEQIRETAKSLYRYSPEGSEEQKLATDLLMELVKRPELSVEQVWQTAEFLYYSSPEGSEARLLATTLLLAQLSRSDQVNDASDVYPSLRRMVPQFHKLPQSLPSYSWEQ